MSDTQPSLFDSTLNNGAHAEPTNTASHSSTTTNGSTFKDNVLNNAFAAADAVSNHPVTQSTTDAVVNGPVGSAVKDQSAKTGNDLSNLASTRAPPSEPAATGQPLTNYHSFFYSLLTWEHKRATAIAFASTIALIFAARYLKLLRFVFKTTYMVLGATAAAEVAGKVVFGHGLTSSFRPRRYYTIPRETLESTLDDVEQLVNFFVIETQRLVFAENPLATFGAFLAAFISYFLIRFTPVWGLALIATAVVYLGPLIYIENKELIDGHLTNASNIANQQASQIKDLAGQHTSRATSTISQYTGDYTTKAQDYLGTTIGKSRQKIVKENDFPNAPQGEFRAPQQGEFHAEKPTGAAPEPIHAS